MSTFAGDTIQATHVIMGRMIFPWADKAPYVDSGHSVLGAFEYNPERDVIKCHLCGRWTRLVGGPHLRSEGITEREYRAAYGLNQSTPLCTPSYSELRRHRPRPTVTPEAMRRVRMARPPKSRDNGNRAEDRNLRSVCFAQIRTRVTALAVELGHTPTSLELTARGIYPKTIVTTYQMSLSKFMESLGLAANPRNGGCTKGRKPQGTPLPVDFRVKYGQANMEASQ